MTTTIAERIVHPYLNFDGRCREAIAFYEKVLGATVECLMPYSSCPDPLDPEIVPPGNEEKIMHGQFRIGTSTLMASDCCCSGQRPNPGVALSLTLESTEAARLAFDALAAEGQVVMPLDKTFFAESFGVVNDRFGICWMLLASPTQA